MHINTHPAVDFERDECVSIRMNSREVIARLEADGWREVRQVGSHKQFRHPTRPGLVTVPSPRRDIPLGTLRSIERQSGVPFR